MQLALSTGTVSAARHRGPLACFLVCFLVIGSPSYIIGDFEWQGLEKYYTDLDLQTPASCRQLYWGGLASSCWDTGSKVIVNALSTGIGEIL